MKQVLIIMLFSLIITICAPNAKAEPFPGALEDPQLIYHPSSKVMLLLGGTPVVHDSVESDVWKWDGQHWARIPAKGPGARVFFKGGLNSKTGKIELFAGAGLGRTNSLMKDLWTFDGKKWIKKPSNDIGSHDHHKMVYADHLNAYVFIRRKCKPCI